MDELLTSEHFTPHVGKMTRFKGTAFSFSIDRVESAGGQPPPGLQRMPFVVIFSGPRDGNIMPEGLYDCEIAGGPTLSLYVSPIHTASHGQQEYQASFN